MSRLRSQLAAFAGGGDTPTLTGLSVLLGSLSGWMIGAHLSFGLLVAVSVLLHVPTRMWWRSAIFGSALGFLFLPARLALGSYLLDATWLGPVLGNTCESPPVDLLVSLFAFDHYVVVGGWALGSVLMVPSAWMTYRIAQAAAYRPSCLAEADREIGQSASSQATWLQRLDGIFARHLLGKALYHRVTSTRPDSRRFRPLAVPLLVAVAVIGAVAIHQLLPTLAAKTILRQLADMTGQSINAEAMRFDVISGDFRLEGVTVCSNQKPAEPPLRVEAVRATIQPVPLLRRRLVIDHAAIRRLSGRIATLGPTNGASPPRQSETDLPWVVPPHDIHVAMNEHLVDPNRLVSRLEAADQLVRGLEAFAAIKVPTPIVHRRSDMYQLRSSLGRSCPAMQIAQLDIEPEDAGCAVGKNAFCTIENLATIGASSRNVTTVRIVAPDAHLEVTARCELHTDDPEYAAELRVAHVYLPTAIERNAFSIDRGTATLTGSVRFVPGAAIMSCDVDLDDLSVRTTGPIHLAGIDPTRWQLAAAKLHRLRSKANIVRTNNDVRLQIDSSRLVGDVRADLALAGHRHLANQLVPHGVANENLTTPQVVGSHPRPTHAETSLTQENGNEDFAESTSAQVEDTASTRVDRSPVGKVDHRPSRGTRIRFRDEVDVRVDGWRSINRDEARSTPAGISANRANRSLVEGGYSGNEASYGGGVSQLAVTDEDRQRVLDRLRNNRPDRANLTTTSIENTPAVARRSSRRRYNQTSVPKLPEETSNRPDPTLEQRSSTVATTDGQYRPYPSNAPAQPRFDVVQGPPVSPSDQAGGEPAPVNWVVGHDTTAGGVVPPTMSGDPHYQTDSPTPSIDRHHQPKTLVDMIRSSFFGSDADQVMDTETAPKDSPRTYGRHLRQPYSKMPRRQPNGDSSVAMPSVPALKERPAARASGWFDWIWR